MKKAVISIAVSVLLMLVVPYIIVTLVPPRDNANSTMPVSPTPAVSETGASVDV